MSSTPQSPLHLVRQQVVGHLDRPVAELIDRALDCLVQAFDARAAFLARIEDHTFEVIDARVDDGPPVERGLRMPLEDTFVTVDDADEDGVVNVRDATRKPPFKGLPMRHRFGIVSYLGAPIRGADGALSATIAVLGKGPRVFTEADQDLLVLVAGLLSTRLRPVTPAGSAAARTPVSAVRLASQEVKEPLEILRGYAAMLTNNEVPAKEMPLVAQRLAQQSETLMRIADQVLLLSRLPLELAFTVRVSLGAVAHSAAHRIRERLSTAGMELRLQLDTQGEVWGDSVLLEAALDEMLHNVARHARTATVVHLRLRPAGPDRFQLIVKDDGPGMSADRLAELFGPLAEEQPERGQGLGLYLLRRVAEAHGGRTWANSLEGKGTTFYLELPGASPDGNSARISAVAGNAPA
jgi:signal transduction histidine kinase